jgi:hypothetical protein
VHVFAQGGVVAVEQRCASIAAPMTALEMASALGKSGCMVFLVPFVAFCKK